MSWSCCGKEVITPFCPVCGLVLKNAPTFSGTSVRVFRDGDQWCAVGHSFINLQESPAGFGDTRVAALLSLSGAQGREK